MSKRIFLIVLDSLGIGNAPDADSFNDTGSNTFLSVSINQNFNAPNLSKLGIFNIDDVDSTSKKETAPLASYARLVEKSNGKDTTVGHWEIAGVTSEKPLPVFKNGFPQYFIEKYQKAISKKVICNMPYSGTEVLKDYGSQSIQQNSLIVYTSADSVFQIAAHQDHVPVQKLYEYCEIARDMLQGDLAVGRVIARPFIGNQQDGYTRTANRHDYSLKPPKQTMLDVLVQNNFDTIGVGKIYDIFAGEGIKQTVKTADNKDGMQKTIEFAKSDFNGICFTNLVDFDMVYGHRNDVDGYANAVTEFDKDLKTLLDLLQKDDILIITADHGCDPATISTDHSRECVPLLIYGENIKQGVNLNTLKGFDVIAQCVVDYLVVDHQFTTTKILENIIK